jgi:hypothetical protein
MKSASKNKTPVLGVVPHAGPIGRVITDAVNAVREDRARIVTEAERESRKQAVIDGALKGLIAGLSMPHLQRLLDHIIPAEIARLEAGTTPASKRKRGRPPKIDVKRAHEAEKLHEALVASGMLAGDADEFIGIINATTGRTVQRHRPRRKS